MDFPLSPIEVAINGFALLLLPLVLFSLLRGSPPPQLGRLSKYYQAEPWLNFVGDLFLLTICAQAAARLARQFGFIDDHTIEMLAIPLGAPFAILFFVYVAFWIRAYRKHNSQNGSAA